MIGKNLFQYLVYYLLFIFLSQNIYGQENDSIDDFNDEYIDTTDSHSITAFHYGFDNYIYDFSFDSNKIDLTLNSYSIGFFSEFMVGGNYDYFGLMQFSYLQPKSIFSSDTLNLKLTGFNLRISFAGQTIFAKKHMAFFLTEGLKFGRLKLVNDKKEKLRNPVLAPFAAAILMFKFSDFRIILMANADYDQSGQKWLEMSFANPIDYKFSKFNQASINYSLGFGYNF